MAEKRNNAMYQNLVDILLEGLEERDPSRIAQVEMIARQVADANNTVAGCVLKNVLASSESKDIFKAWDEWDYSIDSGEPDPEEQSDEKLAEGRFYGSNLKYPLVLSNKVNGSKAPLGMTLYRRLMEDVSDFGKPAEKQRMSKQKRKERLAEKNRLLEEVVEEGDSYITEAEKESRFSGILSKIGVVVEGVKDVLARLGIIYRLSPELGIDDSSLAEDPTAMLVTMQKGRSMYNWYEEQYREGTLPREIRALHRKVREDVFSLERWEALLYHIYQAKNRYVNRQVIVGGVTDDLRLMVKEKEQPEVLKQRGIEGLAPVLGAIVKKYGPADLSGVEPLLAQQNITYFDATRIVEVKPDIHEIRLEANRQTAESFGEDISAVIEKIRPLFMTDKFAWHDEFVKGRGDERLSRHLYAKFLNRDDYRMMKRLLWKASLGKGTLMENFSRNYPIAEFYSTCEELAILAARLRLAEKVAEKKGVDVRNIYDVGPEDAKTLSASDLNVPVRDKEGNLKFRPAAQFSAHPKNKKHLTLEDALEIIDTGKNAFGLDRQFSEFRRKKLPQIKMMAESGLFHEDDVSRIVNYASIAGREVVSPDEAQTTVLKSLLDRIRNNPLVELAANLPEVGKKWYRKAEYSVFAHVAEFYSLFEAELAEKGGADLYMERVEFLERVARQGKIYSGRLAKDVFSTADRLEVRSRAIDMRSLKVSWSGLGTGIDYYRPDLVARMAEDISQRHTTLAELYARDPDMKSRISTLAGLVKQNLHLVRRHLMITEPEMNELAAIVRAEEPKNVYLSDELVKGIDRAYQKISSAMNSVVQGMVNTAVLYSSSQLLYSKHGGNRKYSVFIPKSSDTYKNQHELKGRFGMRYDGNGYVLNDVDEPTLAQMTEGIAELNAKTGSRMKIRLG